MSKKLFYLLSFTWGLPLTLCGYVAALFLMATGHRPCRFGACWHFTVGKRYWGGLNLGPVIFTQQGASESLKCHEHGHGIQNCFMGPLILPLVLLSAARYHVRGWRAARGDVLKPSDAWWFEGQATKIGTRYIRGKEG